MSDKRWLVVRCGSCGQCSGRSYAGGRCPHCGQSMPSTSEVVKEVDSSASLTIEVALANTPPELRDELRKRMQVVPDDGSEGEIRSPRNLMRSLRQYADDEGYIGKEALEALIVKKGLDVDAEALMERAENEGLVLRTGQSRWMFFE